MGRVGERRVLRYFLRARLPWHRESRSAATLTDVGRPTARAGGGRQAEGAHRVHREPPRTRLLRDPPTARCDHRAWDAPRWGAVAPGFPLLWAYGVSAGRHVPACHAGEATEAQRRYCERGTSVRTAPAGASERPSGHISSRRLRHCRSDWQCPSVHVAPVFWPLTALAGPCFATRQLGSLSTGMWVRAREAVARAASSSS